MRATWQPGLSMPSGAVGAALPSTSPSPETMTATVTTARRKQRWHRPQPALPPGQERGPRTPWNRWYRIWYGVWPRDRREWLARLALPLGIFMWLPLAGPLGDFAARIGMIGTFVVSTLAFSAWQRRRTPAPRAAKR